MGQGKEAALPKVLVVWKASSPNEHDQPGHGNDREIATMDEASQIAKRLDGHEERGDHAFALDVKLFVKEDAHHAGRHPFVLAQPLP